MWVVSHEFTGITTKGRFTFWSSSYPIMGYSVRVLDFDFDLDLDLDLNLDGGFFGGTFILEYLVELFLE
jgi:hypothetical protein